jgi:hypothetical protein
MTDAWMPGARCARAPADGGELKGGAPRAVWQALAVDPRSVSARSAAQRLEQLGRPCHLVWNPLSGEIVQLVPIVRAGCSLGCPEGLEQPRPAGLRARGIVPGGTDQSAAIWREATLPEVNAEGRLCVQICVVAFAWEPFTSGPMAGLQPIMRWLDSWDVPRQWPAGRPAAFPHGHAACRSRQLWARGGHFGASQVPGWPADGPGCVDVEMLTGLTELGTIFQPAAPAPAPMTRVR